MLTREDAAKTDVYICGGRPMIESCNAKLSALGFPADALKYERFF